MDAPKKPLAAYDVGWAHEGCVEDDDAGRYILSQQRRALQEILDLFGDDPAKWAKVPVIIDEHNHGATVGLLDFGKRLVVNTQPCRWAVLGALHEKPAEGHVPDGVRLPVREQRSEQHVGARAGAVPDAHHGQAQDEQEEERGRPSAARG